MLTEKQLIEDIASMEADLEYALGAIGMVDKGGDLEEVFRYVINNYPPIIGTLERVRDGISYTPRSNANG